MRYVFNTAPLQLGPSVPADPSQAEIESTPTLRRAGLENAALFGGPVVRAALSVCPIVGDRPYVFVDTKVSLLMPGWYPSIPGWHTDGVPRGSEGDPTGAGVPDLRRQLVRSAEGTPPRFHTVVLGLDNLTRFLAAPVEIDLQRDQDRGLYAEMTEKVEELLPTLADPFVEHGIGQWVTWDDWQVHSATPAVGRGWRLLVRVTESTVPAATDGFIRAQNQVYVPTTIGW